MPDRTDEIGRPEVPRGRRPGGRGGHRRGGVLGPRDRDSPRARGAARLRHPRAGRRGGRHLARQPLPGLRLRRAEPPLLLLVRAQPRLVQRLRRPRRDPRLPRALRRQVRAALAPPPWCRGHPRHLRRGRGPLGARGARRPALQRAPPGAGDGRAQPPRDAGGRGARDLPAAGSFTRRIGTTSTRSGTPGSRSSAPARAPSSSSRTSPKPPPTSLCFSARRRGSCLETTRPTPRPSALVSPSALPVACSTAPASTGATRPPRWPSSSSRGSWRSRGAGPPRT
jgi:hypothetical protein